MDWLKEIRNSCNLTLIQVSKNTGISESFLSQLETGHRRPSVDVAKKLGDFYKIDWTKFFE